MIMNNEKWYQNGLAFRCSGCGNCCAGPNEGYVWVDQAEAEQIARFLNRPLEEFKQKFMRRIRTRHSLIEKQPSKDCIFLTTNADGKRGCEIYSVRPIQCRTWPFWAENLKNSDQWSQAKEDCPGMDQGGWFTVDQIEAIRKGDLSQQKQAIPVDQAAMQWLNANRDNTRCLDVIQTVYERIDHHLAGANPDCKNCGNCCDFITYGHRLYVTTLEMLYLIHGMNSTNQTRPLTRFDALKPQCPWQKKSGCTIRDYRPAGCRIFYCDLNTDFQNDLTEQVLASLRDLHKQFNAVYYYTDLLTWLKMMKKSEE